MVNYDFVGYAFDALTQKGERAYKDIDGKLDEIMNECSERDASMLVCFLSLKCEEEIAKHPENYDKYVRVSHYCYYWNDKMGYYNKWEKHKY